MAKTATAGALSPLLFVGSLDLIGEHQRAVVEQQNYAVCRRPITYVNINAAPVSGLITNSPAGNRISFDDVLNTWVTVLRAHARVSVDIQSFRCSARAVFAGGETGQARFNIGAGTTTINLDSSSADPAVVGTLLTSATGTGLLTITIEIRRTAGGATNYLRNLRIQSAVIAATDLPDPAND